MGIHGLTKLLSDHAPSCMKEQKFDNYFGRKLAVDASMHIYQFMVAVGRTGDQLLTNEAGDVTSHLQGMFYRTVRMLEAGIKPVYVFDGKPPQLKQDQLAMRHERREEALEGLAAAKAAGDAEAVEKFAKRTLKVTREHNEECKRLLRLLGVPVVDAPSEAEAQCAQMAKDGLVYGVATEDMDCLTFGAPKLIRHLMAPSSKQTELPVMEFDRTVALSELRLSDEGFVQMCVLLGCDYCGTIRGVGPVRALELVRKHGSIQGVIDMIQRGDTKTKYEVPDHFPHEPAAEYFRRPEVAPAAQLGPHLKWSSPDEEGLVAYLVGEKMFSEDRVRGAVARVLKAKHKASQGRLESFFGPSTIKPNEKLAAKKLAAVEEAKKSKAAAAKVKRNQNKAVGKLGAKGGVAKGGKAPLGPVIANKKAA